MKILSSSDDVSGPAMKGMQDGCCPTGPRDESGFIDHPRAEVSTLRPAFLPDVVEATRWVLPELACERGLSRARA
jgi:hypothetical protein